MRLKRPIPLIALTILALAGFPVPAHTQEVRGDVQKVKPLWAVDLRPLGFRKPRRGIVNDYGSQCAVAISRSHVAVIFDVTIERGSSIELGRLKIPVRDRGVVLASFDGVSGNRSGMKLFDAPFTHYELFDTSEGRFILVIHQKGKTKEVGGTLLAILSPTLMEEKRVELPVSEGQQLEYWEVKVSPTRKSILLQHIRHIAKGILNGDVNVQNRLLDAETLTLRKSWEDRERVWSITDHDLLCKPSRSTKAPDSVYARKGETPWRAIGVIPGNPRFLSDDFIVAAGGLYNRSGNMEAYRTNGDRVFSHDLKIAGKRTRIHEVVASSEGTRFAAAVDTCVDNRCYGDRRFVFVWDITRQVPIFELRVSARAPMFLPVALSPDGSRLGVVNESKLEVYQLPGAQESKGAAPPP
jgi:hypothetical protein